MRASKLLADLDGEQTVANETPMGRVAGDFWTGSTLRATIVALAAQERAIEALARMTPQMIRPMAVGKMVYLDPIGAVAAILDGEDTP